MKRRYHVLRPGLDEDMVDQTEDVLLDLHGSGHPHYRLEDIQGNLDLAGHIFLADPSEPVVTVVRYARAGTWYVIVEGHDDDRVDEIADLLTARLPVLDIATLYCAAEDGDARDLVRLALGAAAQPDADVTRLLTARLRSADPRTRAAAMESAGLTGFPDLLDVLEEAVEAEQDPDVKEFGATAVAAMRHALSSS
ncbi:hypothetical protein GCM10029964_031310 [Kibdelosporangium lantanae]